MTLHLSIFARFHNISIFFRSALVIVKNLVYNYINRSIISRFAVLGHSGATDFKYNRQPV